MKDEILKLRRKGYTYNQIIEKVGCSKSTISYHCSNNNLGSKILKLSESLIKEINKFYKTHTIEETANKFNVGTATVTKYTKNKSILLTDNERKLKNRERVKKGEKY